MKLIDVAKKNPKLIKEAKEKCKNKDDLKKFAKEKGISISDSEIDDAYAYISGGSSSNSKLNTEELGQVSGGKTSYEEYNSNEIYFNPNGDVITKKK
ncbi:MAG: hypothetical protein LBI55_04185 [Oscillospiraceae bacterium]|jgi:hypothetical protein|nr:hypothetical protein [Oscillospiraceae bacterium]